MGRGERGGERGGRGERGGKEGGGVDGNILHQYFSQVHVYTGINGQVPPEVSIHFGHPSQYTNF